MKKIILVVAGVIVVGGALFLSKEVTPSQQRVEKKIENLRVN